MNTPPVWAACFSFRAPDVLAPALAPGALARGGLAPGALPRGLARGGLPSCPLARGGLLGGRLPAAGALTSCRLLLRGGLLASGALATAALGGAAHRRSSARPT